VALWRTASQNSSPTRREVLFTEPGRWSALRRNCRSALH
jgi:hypothetical protein